MPTNGTRPWESLERQSANLFLLGGVMFATAAALTVVAMMTGDVQSNMVLGEAFIALGWIGPLVGLLGLSFELRERSRRLVQAGRVFTVIGLVAFAYLTVASVYAFVQAIEITDIPIPIAVFLPGIIAGSLLAFVCFSAASLRSDAQSRTLGALMLVPSGIFVTNFVVIPAIRGPGPNPPEIGFIITGLLAVAMLAIGYVLRAEHRPVERSETDTGPVAE
jgi:hypothetical protein